MGVNRTLLTIVLVINFILCASESNDADSLSDMDHLLRGSSDIRSVGSDFDEDDPSKNIEPERVFDNESKEDREYDVEIVNPTAIDQRDIIRTTEVYVTTEVPEAIPEALGLRNESDADDLKLDNNPVDTNDTRQIDLDKTDETPNLGLDKEADGVIVPDSTEMVPDVATTIDNNVYRKTTEDVYSNRDNNVSGETTSSLLVPLSDRPTPQPSDSMEYQNDEEEAGETGGQRNPKTETSQHQPDQRTFDKPRALPTLTKSSTLKSWLEDSWVRPPAGILVPLRPVALTRALAVWNDLTAEGLNLTDIVIVGYDSNGVNWRSRHNLQPTSAGHRDVAVGQALSKLLLKYQDVYSDAANDGTMRALASAAKLVPYDSALFLVTDKGAGDPQRMPLALRALVEKRLKVYTIWTDPSYPSAESEQALQDLKNVSVHTEGEVLPYSLQVVDVDTNSNFATEAELQQWSPEAPQQARKARVNMQENTDMFDTILIRRGGHEAISVGMPIENGVSAIRVVIEGAVDHAVLYPPDEAPQIDLYNQTSVSAFSPASRTAGLTPRDVYLVFPGAQVDFDMLSVVPATPAPADVSTKVGVWHLSVRCDRCDYRIQVSVFSRLHFDTEVESDTLKLHVSGPVASVRESLLVDEYGSELAKLSFNYQPTGNAEPEMDGAITDLEADMPFPNVKTSTMYAKIVGRDFRGEPFVRLSGPISQQSEVRMGRSASIQFPDSKNLELVEEEDSKVYARQVFNDSNVLPFDRAVSQVVNQGGSILTAVQIGLSTRLYGAPGDRLQLHFEVTNFRERAVRFNFGAVGELRFLRGIEPTAQTVGSGETVNVIVTAVITSTAQPGARDLVTFTAFGLEQVSISAFIYVTNPGSTVRDVWAPEVRHNFQGSCIGRQGSDCAEHAWSATIIARDSVGGLLRLSSSPIGLMYESNFISGTREEVMATYRANCCNPRVMINAVDAFGNANSYVVDISNYFTEAAIAAIALGVILLIALVALIIFVIYWCVRRRKQSRELPSYNTSGSRNIS